MRLFVLFLTILLVFSINPVMSHSSDHLEYGVYTSVISDYEMSRNVGENIAFYGFVFRTQIWNYQTSNVSIVDHCNELSLEVEGEIEDNVDLISDDLMPYVNICTDDLRPMAEVIEGGELREIYAVVGMSLVGNQSSLPLGNYTFSFTNVDDIDNELVFPFNVTISVEQNGDSREQTVIEDSVVDNFGELDPFETDDTAEDSAIFDPIILISSFTVLVLIVKEKKNKNT